MSGNRSRRKGKAGEREAREVLAERDYEVIDLTDGTAVCDFLAMRRGKTYFCEVKNCADLSLQRFERQARSQAKHHRWMLLCRLAGYPKTFLVTRSDAPPSVWSAREET